VPRRHAQVRRARRPMQEHGREPIRVLLQAWLLGEHATQRHHAACVHSRYKGAHPVADAGAHALANTLADPVALGVADICPNTGADSSADAAPMSRRLARVRGSPLRHLLRARRQRLHVRLRIRLLRVRAAQSAALQPRVQAGHCGADAEPHAEPHAEPDRDADGVAHSRADAAPVPRQHAHVRRDPGLLPRARSVRVRVRVQDRLLGEQQREQLRAPGVHQDHQGADAVANVRTDAVAHSFADAVAHSVADSLAHTIPDAGAHAAPLPRRLAHLRHGRRWALQQARRRRVRVQLRSGLLGGADPAAHVHAHHPRADAGADAAPVRRRQPRLRQDARGRVLRARRLQLRVRLHPWLLGELRLPAP